MRYIDMVNAKREKGRKIQEMLNLRYQRNGFIPKDSLVFWAMEEHKQYPQYEGHWDAEHWKVEPVTRRVKTKMGLAFEQNDISLVTTRKRLAGGYEITAYSFRNSCDTLVYTIPI